MHEPDREGAWLPRGGARRQHAANGNGEWSHVVHRGRSFQRHVGWQLESGSGQARPQERRLRLSPPDSRVWRTRLGDHRLVPRPITGTLRPRRAGDPAAASRLHQGPHGQQVVPARGCHRAASAESILGKVRRGRAAFDQAVSQSCDGPLAASWPIAAPLRRGAHRRRTGSLGLLRGPAWWGLEHPRPRAGPAPLPRGVKPASGPTPVAAAGCAPRTAAARPPVRLRPPPPRRPPVAPTGRTSRRPKPRSWSG